MPEQNDAGQNEVVARPCWCASEVWKRRLISFPSRRSALRRSQSSVDSFYCSYNALHRCDRVRGSGLCHSADFAARRGAPQRPVPLRAMARFAHAPSLFAFAGKEREGDHHRIRQLGQYAPSPEPMVLAAAPRQPLSILVHALLTTRRCHCQDHRPQCAGSRGIRLGGEDVGFRGAGRR